MTARKTPAQKVKQRPAETTTIVAGIIAAASLVGYHLTGDQAAAIVAVVAAVPAVVTFIKARAE